MRAQRVTLPYAPRPIFLPYHKREQRWSCLVAHRRCGKTVACINDLIRKAVTLKIEHGRYAYVAPLLNQAKEIAWDYLKRFARPITTKTNESELWVELVNGARIRLHGADNPDRLRGSYLDGIVMDEYAQMPPSVWGEVIRPMLADRLGWATFIGTPKGRNDFFKVYEAAGLEPERWFRAMLRASETKLLGATEIAEMTRDLTPEQIEQELECSFDAAILGAYYGKEISDAEAQGRIRDVAYEPAVPVDAAWDLGKGVNMAVWLWQIVGKEIHVIDHVEGAHSDGIPQVLKKLDDRPFKIRWHWVPHDGKATEIGTGRTRIETFILNNRTPRLVADHKVDDGINAARMTLPRVYFDRLKCADGIEALRQYKAEFDEKVKAFKNLPKHDWTSHSADAFRYLCMAWREIAQPVPEKPTPPMRGIENMTVDELHRMDRDNHGRMRV